MNGLATFSDWVLAFLPRLFVYPGGLWLLAAILVLRSVGSKWKPAYLARLGASLVTAHLLALAVAWVAVALLPLPGATLLPLPADRLIVLSLLALSLVLDRPSVREGGLAGAITLALLAPLAAARSLTGTAAEGGIEGWLASAAAAVGLVLIWPQAAKGLASASRWPGWLGLALAPLLAIEPPVSMPPVLWASLLFVAGILVLGAAGRLLAGVSLVRRYQVAVAWAAALVALMVALVRI